MSAFKELGQKEIVSDSLLLRLEAFVCHRYGKPTYTSTDKLRYDTVRQKYLLKGQSPLSSLRGRDISLLPPCRQALRMHCLRANYQAMIWRQADVPQPEIPDPSSHVWTKNTDGALSIYRCKDLFPKRLVDILYENQTANDEKRESLYDAH